MKAPDLKQYFCMLFEDCSALSATGILLSSPHSLCRSGKFWIFFLLLLALVFFHRFTVLIDTCGAFSLLVSKVVRILNTPVCSLCDLRAWYMICASSFAVDLAGIGPKARPNMPLTDASLENLQRSNSCLSSPSWRPPLRLRLFLFPKPVKSPRNHCSWLFPFDRFVVLS